MSYSQTITSTYEVFILNLKSRSVMIVEIYEGETTDWATSEGAYK